MGVETREKCHHTPTGPVCDKEVLKREICPPVTVGVCKKVSADFEVVEMREKCRPTPTGPLCDKEVLKREQCKAGRECQGQDSGQRGYPTRSATSYLCR